MPCNKITDGLTKIFYENPPTEELVRGQEVKFGANQWIKRWPSELPRPDFLEADAEYRVNRQDLFDMASKINSSSEVLELYIWIAGWGTGTKALSISRAAKVLEMPDLTESLWESYSTVYELGAVEAYRRLRSWDFHRVKHFGPAFFTKWLYFCAYDSWENDSPAPLILDRRVATSLCWPTSGWRSSDYSRYLELVSEWRDRLAPDQGTHLIEFALFKANGFEE